MVKLLLPLKLLLILNFLDFYIPPTFVLTTSKPELAASTIAIQKASVKEVFKKICPLTITSLTCLCGIAPIISTLSYKLCFSLIASKGLRLGPSPPTIK